MSATYDESKHNRAGDGKFATKDGGREAAGQVVDAFADADEASEYTVPKGRENLDAHHELHASIIQNHVDAGQMHRDPTRSQSRPGISVDYFRTHRHELGTDSQGNRLLARVVSQHETFDDDDIAQTSELDHTGERWTSGVEFDVLDAGQDDAYMARPVSLDTMSDEQRAMVPDSLRELDEKTLSQETNGTVEQERSVERMRAKYPEMDESELTTHALRYVRDDRGHSYGRAPLYNPMDPRLVGKALADATSKPKAGR